MAETTEQYRARINQLKTSIENEPYMKDMRSDIAEGISKTGNRQADIEVRQDTLEDDFVAVQQDASAVSPSGAEVAVARGSYPTLDQRLTEEEQKVTAQLAETGDNVNELIRELYLARGSETGLDERMNRDLIETKTLISDKIDKAGSGQVYYANLAQDVRSAMTGNAVAIVGDDSIITSNITHNAVTADKISSESLVETANVLDLNTLMDGKYYGGVYSGRLNEKVILKESAPWNGSRYPIPVKAGDVVRYNQSIYGEYFVGVDDDLIIRQYGPTNAVIGPAEVTVQTGVTGFYAAVRDEHLNSTMITINKPMPTEYIPHKTTAEKKLSWLKVDYSNLTEDVVQDIEGSGIFIGKKANFLGDSITNGQYLSSKNYSWPSIVGEKLKLSTVNNYGINGSSVSSGGSNPMVERYDSMAEDADIIFFMGSRNDFGSSSDAFGDMSTPSSQTNTFYGALKNIAEGLKTKYPNKLIIFCTPPHGSSTSIPETKPNATTEKVYGDYVQAIREVAIHYSIPVCDLWNNAGIQPLLEVDNETYFRHNETTMDGVHPNNIGHKRIAERVSGFVKTLVS